MLSNLDTPLLLSIHCHLSFPPILMPIILPFHIVFLFSSNPTPYRPSAPSKITQKASSTTPTPNPPSKTLPTTSHKTSTTTINIRTATGGTKRICKHQKPTSSPAPTYICDGIGCVSTTKSPYKFTKHQSIPQNWQPGFQN